MRLMKKFILFTLSLLFVTAGLHAKLIKFVNAEKAAVANVKCDAFTEAGDSITSWVSNVNGEVNTSDVAFNYLVTQATDFSSKIIYASKLYDGLNIVELAKSVELSEVVVTPGDMQEFDTYRSYTLKMSDMNRYSTALDALNLIPNLTVLSSGGIYLEGNNNVKLLIDGVDATQEEVRSLSKEDISKVNVYTVPPARFLAQGITSIVDIKLKNKLVGGNGAINISQAFQSLVGSNSAMIFYNNRSSRFSLSYNNNNTHYHKYRVSDELDYSFDGVEYKKDKKGRNSKKHTDDNTVGISYQLNKRPDFLYNVQAGFSTNRNGVKLNQEVFTNGISFPALNELRTKYDRFNIANYFEKKLGNGQLLANVNYQHYNTYYRSSYQEFSDNSEDFADAYSQYNTRVDGVFSDVQYEISTPKAGVFTVSLFDAFKQSRYVDSQTPFFQKTNDFGATLSWWYRINKISIYAGMGVDYIHENTSLLSTSYNKVNPNPFVNLYWNLNKDMRFDFAYSYTSDSPSIAQLSETDQWLDTRLVYHGNAKLSPYSKHNAYINFVMAKKYIALSWRNFFTSQPHYICDMFTLAPEYMLQTFVNLKKYYDYGTQLSMTLMPLGNSKLAFWNRVILMKNHGANDEYSWSATRFQWMTQLSMNLERWSVALFYQYPGKIAMGQLVRPRTQAYSISATYRPINNLSIGLEWMQPFGKGWRESEYTVKDAPVYMNNVTYVGDRANLITFKLSYNFNYGRKRDNANPQISNGDDDSGLLRK